MATVMWKLTAVADFCKKVMKNEIRQHGPNSAVYGLGLIGALIYFISNATGFWMGALGLLKAFVWPAFLVYEALKVLNA
jgi:hypothetical protein